MLGAPRSYGYDSVACPETLRFGYGSARPWADFPRLVNLYLANRLSIDPMISRTYRLEEINEAYEARDGSECYPVRLIAASSSPHHAPVRIDDALPVRFGEVPRLSGR